MRQVVMVLAVLVQASAAAAQVVHGRVVTPDSLALPGAVVIGNDSADVPVVAALADDSGRFSLRFPSAGEFRLHVMRVGHANSTDRPLRLRGGESVERTVVADGARVTLPDEQRD